MELNKSYFIKAAEIFEMSVSKYLEGVDYNYAIISGKSGSPLCFSDGYPVFYGDWQGAMEDAKEEEGEYVITERELLEKFCHDEYSKFTQTREVQPSVVAKKMVTEQIINMLDNNVLNGWGMESFLGWLEDGDGNVFFNADRFTDEQIAEAIALAKEIAPIVDKLSWKLALENDES